MDELPPQHDDDELVTIGEPIRDVVGVTLAGPLALTVRFENGVEGRVRFEPSYLCGVFELLKDPDYFAQVGIAHGSVSWPNERPDLAPDAMYDAIKRNGEWVLA